MMRSLQFTLPTLLARFLPNERGVAAVEFALIVPFLITLYFGSIEASALYTADKRINSISATLGDLVSQWDPSDGNLPTSTLSDYSSAAAGLIVPYSSAGLKQVVSLIQVKADGTSKVLWSKAYGGGTARVVGQPYAALTATSQMNTVSRGGCVIASESAYSYKPILGQVFTTALNLASVNYFLPRYGATVPINLDSTSLTSTACTS